MNYNKLKSALSEKKITIEKFCQELGMSTGGFHMMIRNETMKVSLLERIAEYLDVPVSYFFEESTLPTKLSNTSAVSSGLKSDRLNRAVEQLIKAKDDQIQEQKEQIEFLRNIINKSNNPA